KQRNHLQAQIELEREKADVEEQRLQSQIDSGRKGVVEFELQQSIQTERINIAQRQMNSAAELALNGYLSKVELRRRQDAYLAERQSQSSLTREATAKQAELIALQDNLRQLPIVTRLRIAQLAASITEIDGRLKEIDAHRGYQLLAPTAGRVSTLQAWIGKA